MKVKLLKKIRKEYHIKYNKITTNSSEIHLISKDFKHMFELDRHFPDLIFFIECFMLISMTKFKEIRTIRKNKRRFRA